MLELVGTGLLILLFLKVVVMVMNHLIIMNIADKEVRKAVVHAVNKVPICVEINQ